MGVLQGVLHSFSIKNVFHGKMDLRLFYFGVIYFLKSPKLDTLQVFIFTNTECLHVVIRVNLQRN